MLINKLNALTVEERTLKQWMEQCRSQSIRSRGAKS